jgi:hypothetical protein
MARLLRFRFIPLFTVLFLINTLCYADAQSFIKNDVTVAPTVKPLVLFYSRAGTTRTVALAIANQLSWEAEEVVSRKNRHYLGTVTCVFDQLFDRDDDVEPLQRDLSGYNPVLIASPVWIHKISSPMRTLLKQSRLENKEAFLVLTNNGNFDEKDEKGIRENIASYGFMVRGCYPICTSDKDDAALRRDARKIVEDIISFLHE